jgi:hypothetical protein
MNVLFSPLYRYELLALGSGRFSPGERETDVHLMRGLVGPTVCTLFRRERNPHSSPQPNVINIHKGPFGMLSTI